jgi:BirA family biotin operon repressor/biotin-[acetyl-CoA-carboxylase] ligase
LEILSFKTLNSTQLYLVEALKDKKLSVPICVIAKEQISGIGSRENSWEGGEGNLFFSFAVDLNVLPEDLPLSATAIYFSYLMKAVLEEYVEDIWLKWPNDFYHKDAKVGGIISKKIDTVLVCGIGVNLQKNQNGFQALNLDVDPLCVLKSYLKALEKYPSWKQIFSQYKIEFGRSKAFFAHIEGEYKSLENSTLSEDGSLIIDNKRVYNIR